MSLVTANGVPVLSLTLSLPRVGRWVADMLVADTALDSRVALGIGSLAFVGAVVRQGEVKGNVSARVVGGMNGLDAVLPARAYRNVSLHIALEDICKDAGEALSPAADAVLLGTMLPSWTRMSTTGLVALSNLLSGRGAAWRTLADGTLWAGVETWPAAADFDYVDLPDVPHLGVRVLSSATPRIFPGQTFEGAKVSVVEHRIESTRLRTRLWMEDA